MCKQKFNGLNLNFYFSVINSSNDQVDITPVTDAPTYVNGDLILEKTVLHHVILSLVINNFSLFISIF